MVMVIVIVLIIVWIPQHSYGYYSIKNDATRASFLGAVRLVVTDSDTYSVSAASAASPASTGLVDTGSGTGVLVKEPPFFAKAACTDVDIPAT